VRHGRSNRRSLTDASIRFRRPMTLGSSGEPPGRQKTRSRSARRVRELAIVPAIGLHGLRHTHATLLLEAGDRRQDCERSARPRQRSDHSRAVWPRNFENAEQCSSPLRIVARGRSRRNSHRSVRELKGAVSVFKSRSLVSLRQSDPTASYLHDSVRAEPPSNPGQFTALVWQDPSDWQSRLAVNSVYCGGHFGAVPRGASRYG